MSLLPMIISISIILLVPLQQITSTKP